MTWSKRSFLVLAALVSCGEPQPEPSPLTDLQAGFARVRMPAPVGIGTVGYGGFGISSDPSPFAEIYPATTRIHGHPEFKALALSRGAGHEVVFVRMDTVGVFQQLRQGVLQELERRHGRSFDDVVVFGATHTHAGPGRIIDSGGPFDLIADRFFPEFYVRVVEALADVVDAALEDLGPARLGVATGNTSEGHEDRRCEDGREYTNGSLPMLAVEREGNLEVLLGSYAIHGTVLGIDDLTLSQDVTGAIEEAVEDRFDRPVEVMLFNSWAADMSPSSPSVADTGTSLPGGYEQMEAVGQVVADEMEAVASEIAWVDAPELRMRTHRVFINRALLGYDDDTFDYDYGGVYCSGTSDCDPETTVDGLDEACVPFSEEYPAPGQTVFSAGRVGPLHFVTFPGEPGTLLAEEIMDTVGVEPFMFFGYSQDYLGYSILEEDWWQGGYEASGALWGPRQGEWLKEAAIDAFMRMESPAPVLDGFSPAPATPFDVTISGGYASTTGQQAGTVLVQPNSVGGTGLVQTTIAGLDPWEGPPVATLERVDGTPVLRPNGMPVDSDSYAFWVDLEPVPSYRDEPEASERRFEWTFNLPATRGDAGVALDGDYRLRVLLPDGTEVITEAFTVTP